MTCQQIEEILSLYLERETTPEEKLTIEQHLEGCPKCSKLLSYLKETKEFLARFPELEPSEDLLTRLYAIAGKKKRFRLGLDFFLKPSLQPVFTVATIFLVIISFYFFNPDKKSIDKSIDRQIHLGYSKVEKLYAQAESLTSNLGAYKDSFIDSIKNLKITRNNED